MLWVSRRFGEEIIWGYEVGKALEGQEAVDSSAQIACLVTGGARMAGPVLAPQQEGLTVIPATLSPPWL